MTGRLVSLSLVVSAIVVVLTWALVGHLIVRGIEVNLRIPTAKDAVVMRLALIQAAAVWAVTCGLLIATIGRTFRELSQLIDEFRYNEGIATGEGSSELVPLRRMLKQTQDRHQEERLLAEDRLRRVEQANAELFQAQTQLVQKERLASVGQLAAGVAHEVGNPLSGILGYASLLGKRLSGDATSAGMVAAIQDEVRRIDGIVRTLVEMGRPPRVDAQPIQLNKTVASALSVLSKAPELEYIELHIDIPESIVVEANSGSISQIVINLVRNAAQAIEGAGRIELGTRSRAQASEVELYVRDSGPGLKPDVQERLFELFYTTKDTGKGSGIGLAMSKHLALQMGGDLRGANRPDGASGAEFVLVLKTPAREDVPNH